MASGTHLRTGLPMYYSGDVGTSDLIKSLSDLNLRKEQKDRLARAEARQTELDRIAEEDRQRKIKEEEFNQELARIQFEKSLAANLTPPPPTEVKIGPQGVTLKEPPLPNSLEPSSGQPPSVTEGQNIPLSPGFEGTAPSPLPFGEGTTLTTPSGKTIKIPYEYRPDVLKRIEEEAKAKTVMVTIPDKPEFGAMAGAKLPKDVADNVFSAILRKFGEKPFEQQLSEAEKLSAARARGTREGNPSDTASQQKAVDAYVDDFQSGVGVLSDVPGSLRDEVKAAAAQRRVGVPTRKLSEKAIESLTDAQGLIQRTGDLRGLESGYQFAFSNWTPNLVKGYLAQETNNKFFEKALQYEPAYFLYTAETLKAIQGSRPSDFDMQTYLTNLPKITDPPNVRAAKIDGLMRQLTNRYNTKLKAYDRQGFNVNGFEVIPSSTPSGGGGLKVLSIEEAP